MSRRNCYCCSRIYNSHSRERDHIAVRRPPQHVVTPASVREACRTPRASQHRNRTVPQTTSAVGGNTTTPPRLIPQGYYQDSPRRRDRSVSPRRGNASPTRCKYCNMALQSGTAAEHDENCSLRPFRCQNVNIMTGVVCGYRCRGKAMLAKHELHCSSRQRCWSWGSSERQTPSRRKSCDASQRQTPLKKTLVCHKCKKAVGVFESLAKHREVCTEEEVLCPLLCGQKFRRRDVVSHVKNHALEHRPMDIHNTKYAEDDPRVILAVLMNVVLEQRGLDTGSGVLSQSANVETPIHNNTQSSCPHLSIIRSCTPSVSRKSSVPSVLAQSNRVATPSFDYFHRHSLSESPASVLLEPGAAKPQGRKATSQPVVPEESGAPLANRGMQRRTGFGEVLPDRSSASVKSEYSEFIIPSTIASAGESPVVWRNEENEAVSINKEEFDNLLHCMDLQRTTIDKLNEEHQASEVKSMNENEILKCVDDMPNLVNQIDAQNKRIHVRVMRFMDYAGVAPTHVMKVLAKWKSLDRHWYEVKLPLYDDTVAN